MILEPRTAHCGSILHFRADPGLLDDPGAYQFWEQGALIVADGHVEAVGPAAGRGLRMIAGKTLMDRHCPQGLCDSAAEGERDMRELIETWHGRGRLHYAITPRFAATSSAAQLQGAGRLAAEFPDVYIHSHLAE